MQSDILRITKKPLTDEGIVRCEWQECNPVIGTNLNNAGEIRLTLESQDTINHPAESYLLHNKPVSTRLLRERAHNFVLPPRDNRNFASRALYKGLGLSNGWGRRVNHNG